MPKIKCNDIDIYYEEKGTGDALVFIHGFSADHFTWALVEDYFAKEYRVITLDNRGSGQTDVPDAPYSIKTMADDVASLCHHLNIAKAHIVGSSMGGKILQQLCHTHKALINKAVICCSYINISRVYLLHAEALLEMMQQNIQFETCLKDAFAWCFSSNFIDDSARFNKLLQLAVENPYPISITGYKNQLQALKTFHPEDSDWLENIPMECLVLGAEADIICPPGEAVEMANLIPNASYHEFENCGHLPQLEVPEAFCKVVDEFLKP